jgi:hypothetical protein
MSVGKAQRFLAMAGVLLLASCATDTTVYYAPPPGLTAGQAVSVLGSKQNHFFLQSSEYHLVWAVDGQVVKDSARRWDEPLLVTAGEKHRLSVAYGWGAVAGSIEMELAGRPGSSVIVEGEAVDPDKQGLLWLADATSGAVIGGKQQVSLSYSPSPPLPINTDEIALRLIDKHVVP